MNRTVLAAFALPLLLLASACEPPAQPAVEPTPPPSAWRLACAHDDQGNVLEGSKEELIEAVRAGKPVRLYVRGRRVEHAADAMFLTVLEGEVFAQVAEIQMQAPAVDPPSVTFREPGRYWRAIYGTTGVVVGLGDGNEPRENRNGVRWFVRD